MSGIQQLFCACCSYLDGSEQEDVYSRAFWGSRDPCGIRDKWLSPFVTSNKLLLMEKPECEAWTCDTSKALEQISHSMDEPRRCWWPLHLPKVPTVTSLPVSPAGLEDTFSRV